MRTPLFLLVGFLMFAACMLLGKSSPESGGFSSPIVTRARHGGAYLEGIFVKAYVITTGTVFGLIVVAHIWRAIAEGPDLVRNPVYILLTVVPAGLALWAWRVLRAMPRP
jgi:hypothetical protein